jgi:hypothetical protein
MFKGVAGSFLPCYTLFDGPMARVKTGDNGRLILPDDSFRDGISLRLPNTGLMNGKTA